LLGFSRVSQKKKLKHLSANFDNAAIDNSQAARCTERNSENAVVNSWSAVSDASNDRFIGRKISHANFRTKPPD
jgi:hypothetical protein